MCEGPNISPYQHAAGLYRTLKAAASSSTVGFPAPASQSPLKIDMNPTSGKSHSGTTTVPSSLKRRLDRKPLKAFRTFCGGRGKQASAGEAGHGDRHRDTRVSTLDRAGRCSRHPVPALVQGECENRLSSASANGRQSTRISPRHDEMHHIWLATSCPPPREQPGKRRIEEKRKPCTTNGVITSMPTCTAQQDVNPAAAKNRQKLKLTREPRWISNGPSCPLVDSPSPKS